MMGKSIPLNNGQWKERIFVVTGCSWYLDEMEGMHVSCQDQDQDSLLVKRRNNHSPEPVIRELVPSSHQRSELSNTILCIFSR